MRTFIVAVAVALSVGCADNRKAQTGQDKSDKPEVQSDKDEENRKNLRMLVSCRSMEDNDKQPDESNKDKQPEKTEQKNPAPIPQEQWNFQLAEKTWGIKLKSMEYVDKTTKVTENTTVRTNHYRFPFEFSRELTAEELKLFNPKTASLAAVAEFVCLDADNVIRQKTSQFTLEGEISGMKGDAFWLILQPPYNNDMNKIVRVELRPKK